ncbi:small nuclear ribonucleoprotein G [Carpediemonas membranifera]|uniref:Sm protein G n=1 Tax=Carpediemonas membranifera TaxID=201153 RepID=A0A8J6DZ48_9EUKA|nr:small nuclear ribonucleoprotein G [Carpediemonas membranifera]|eukprot:KAG9389951.1 small nuclear ribonucleoprotein G [Carpediemonas membranifera]
MPRTRQLKLPPGINTYLNNRVELTLIGNRRVEGVLMGYDVFSNLTIVETQEKCKDGSTIECGTCVVRGNSVISVVPLETI